MKVRVSLVVSLLLIQLAAQAAWSNQSTPPGDNNGAVIFGDAGEQYPIIGSGGIKVTGGHHGLFRSNMKRSSIEIDGSGIVAQRFAPVSQNTDFTASPGSVYFVSQTCTCSLPPAAAAAGQEVVVCVTGDNVAVTYKATSGDRLFGANQTGIVVSSNPGKVDRFICDGSTWYRE